MLQVVSTELHRAQQVIANLIWIDLISTAASRMGNIPPLRDKIDPAPAGQDQHLQKRRAPR